MIQITDGEDQSLKDTTTVCEQFSAIRARVAQVPLPNPLRIGLWGPDGALQYTRLHTSRATFSRW